jgi:hypothetical protein
VSEFGGLAEPSELRLLRAKVGTAQDRVERASRRLELAADLEARLNALLQAAALPVALRPASPEREATELEATQVLLQAELRAARILNGSQEPGPPAISPEVAHALQLRLRDIAELEDGLVELGRRALQLKDREEGGCAPHPVGPADQVVPVEPAPGLARKRPARNAKTVPPTARRGRGGPPG